MNKKYIQKMLPELRNIKKHSIRSGVVTAWLLAMRTGGWNKIDDIPFTLLIKTKRTLIDHTRAITRMAMAVARERSDLNMDVIIAGGLVHDVGKLLEYERKGKKFVKSAGGRLVRHPVSGYRVVVEAGLSLEIAHIVATHSSEGDHVQRSREAIVIHHCDFIDFEIAKSQV
jgi:putative nucleotidyltransferase with HDIG domain